MDWLGLGKAKFLLIKLYLFLTEYRITDYAVKLCVLNLIFKRCRKTCSPPQESVSSSRV
jgi:hypothetical protein